MEPIEYVNFVVPPVLFLLFLGLIIVLCCRRFCRKKSGGHHDGSAPDSVDIEAGLSDLQLNDRTVPQSTDVQTTAYGQHTVDKAGPRSSDAETSLSGRQSISVSDGFSVPVSANVAADRNVSKNAGVDNQTFNDRHAAALITDVHFTNNRTVPVPPARPPTYIAANRNVYRNVVVDNQAFTDRFAAAHITDVHFTNNRTVPVRPAHPPTYIQVEYESEDDLDDSRPRFPKNAYRIFKKRHLVDPRKMPDHVNGWNNLMRQRRLHNRNRHVNTFIIGFPSDFNGLFTDPVDDDNHESNIPIRIVNLKRNRNSDWYDVVFDGEAYVVVTLDEKGHPGHFVSYEEAY